MSQSPLTADVPSREGTYLRNWDALGEMVKRGSSFSGRERNCVFLNTGNDQPFADVSAVSGLDFSDDGRCVGLVDWDHDGDQDLWLVNRTSPRVRVMRNDLANANRHVAIKLEGKRCNREAIGARVELTLADGQILSETVRAGDGFLTQSTKWLHFGVRQEKTINGIRVRWPGDTQWQELRQTLETNQRYKIVQDRGLEELPPTQQVELPETPALKKDLSLPERVVLTSRVDISEPAYRTFQGEPGSLHEHRSKPVLVSLWASWCSPCIQELSEFSRQKSDLLQADVTFLPLNVDAVHAGQADDSAASLKAAQQLAQDLNLPTPAGVATKELVSDLTHLVSWIFYRQRPLPLPCSFLLDKDGRIAVVYRGSVSPEQVIADMWRLEMPTQALMDDTVFPGTGRFLFPDAEINPLLLVRSYREGGYPDDAKTLLLKSIDEAQQANARPALVIPLFRELSMIEAVLGNNRGVVEACRKAAELAPNDLNLSIELAVAMANLGERAQASERLRTLGEAANEPKLQRKLGHAWLAMKDAKNAAVCFTKVLKSIPEDNATRFQLGTCEQILGNLVRATNYFEQVLTNDSNHVMAANNLAWIFATSEDAAHRNGVRAVQLAKLACQLTRYKSPVLLGTLSASFAEAGEFEQAIEAGEQAISLAKVSGQTRLIEDLEKRLQLHRRRLPYRDR